MKRHVSLVLTIALLIPLLGYQQPLNAHAETKKSEDIPSYVIAESNILNKTKDGKRQVLYKGRNQYLLVAPDSRAEFKKLSDNLIDFYEKDKTDFEKSSEIMTKTAQADYDDGRLLGEYGYLSNVMVQRADSEILSYFCSYYGYEGGVHGGYGIIPYTYDVETGKELKLSDIIKISDKELQEILIPKIKETNDNYKDDSYMEMFGSIEDTLSAYEIEYGPDYEKDDDDIKKPYTWYLGYDGIHFYFGIYSLASFADGVSDVVIGYNEKPAIFKEYLPAAGADKSAMWQITSPYGVMMDIKGDGNLSKVTVDDIYKENADYSKDSPIGVYVDIDGNREEYTADYMDDAKILGVYRVLTASGGNYIYVRCGTEGNDGKLGKESQWLFFDVSGDAPKFVSTKMSDNTIYDEDIEVDVKPAYTNPDIMVFK